MANPKKIPIGSRVSRFPAGTFNALVEGELRNRQPGHGGNPPIANGFAKSTVIVRLVWDGEETLPPGSVVKLGEVIKNPTSRPEVVREGLQFRCSEPTPTDEHVAITMEPMRAGQVGYGHIPQAAWALVNITDAEHGFAKVDAGTELESDVSSGFPIVWKETGTGSGKWAVVKLGSGNAAAASGRAILFGTLEPASLVLDLDATDSSAAGVNHGDQVGEDPVIIPLVFSNGDYEAQLWGADSEGTEGEPMKLPGENHCWGTCIVGGDGQEIGSTGVYNEPPMLVEGFTFKKIIGEGESAEEVTYYAVTDVITPLVAFTATADSAVTGADFDATPVLGIHGLLPEGTKEIQNELGWDIDSGGTVIVVKGFDTAGVKYWAFNAECPT